MRYRTIPEEIEAVQFDGANVEEHPDGSRFFTPEGERIPRNGVWRRGASDWAYRVEVEGYGSIFGVGFSSRDEARAAKNSAREDAERRRGEGPLVTRSYQKQEATR